MRLQTGYTILAKKGIVTYSWYRRAVRSYILLVIKLKKAGFTNIKVYKIELIK